MTDLLLNAGRRIRELEAERDAARNLAKRRLQERESWAATAAKHAKAADRLATENARLRERAQDAERRLEEIIAG